jgi:hypothetical protein
MQGAQPHTQYLPVRDSHENFSETTELRENSDFFLLIEFSDNEALKG